MVDTADWQTEATNPVLRVLYSAGIAISPGAIAVNLDEFTEEDFARDTIEDALDGMETQNLVRTPEEDYYLLTDHGRDYVDRELEQQGVGFID